MHVYKSKIKAMTDEKTVLAYASAIEEQNHRMGGDAFAGTGESQTFLGGGLDIHL